MTRLSIIVALSSDPNVTCPGVGQACVSLYEQGMAPPEFAKVGICMLP